MTDKLKIVSLCDGMSCGALALEHLARTTRVNMG